MASSIQKHIIRVGLMLGLFAIVATALVALTEQQTRDKIKENERQALLDGINTLVLHQRYNNDILHDTATLAVNEMLGKANETVVYRARKDGQPIAAVFDVVAPDGYSGSITLLIGVNYDGSLAGARVINHKETPGLGDKIDDKRSDWILQFEGLSLIKPIEARWKVKKDGGEFDQFTGATITPRAVVKAIKKALQYFKQNRDVLFAVTEDTQ